jgi:hypothetical protein
MPYSDYDGRDAGYILCSTPADAGSITIPAALMENMPPDGYAFPVLIGRRDTLIVTDAGYIDVVLENAARAWGEVRFSPN